MGHLTGGYPTRENPMEGDDEGGLEGSENSGTDGRGKKTEGWHIFAQTTRTAKESSGNERHPLFILSTRHHWKNEETG